MPSALTPTKTMGSGSPVTVMRERVRAAYTQTAIAAASAAAAARSASHFQKPRDLNSSMPPCPMSPPFFVSAYSIFSPRSSHSSQRTLSSACFSSYSRPSFSTRETSRFSLAAVMASLRADIFSSAAMMLFSISS